MVPERAPILHPFEFTPHLLPLAATPSGVGRSEANAQITIISD